MALRRIRILYLSNDTQGLLYPALIQVALSHEVEFDVVEEVKDLGSANVYKPTPELCEKINRLTQGQGVDLVIIMNNLGAGLVKAKAVAPTMTSKTLVIWGMGVRNTGPYQDLGIVHLGHQLELYALILAALGFTA